MSSTGQATSSNPNVQLIIDALDDYAKVTGVDLSKNRFTTTLKQSNSPKAILELLHGQENTFKEYRDGNRRLINCLSPAVTILQAFSGILGEAASLVSHTCYPHDSFNVASTDTLFTSERIVCRDRCSHFCTSVEYISNQIPLDVWEYQAASGVTSSYDAVLDLFECLGNFLKRLEIYTTIPPIPAMTDIIVKIMMELLSVLALATKQIEQGRFSKCAVTCTLRSST